MLIYLSLLETDAEKEAFLALYSQYHQAMLRLARRYFPTDQMSLEDAVQNAWVKIIQNFPKIRTLEGKNRGAYCVITVKKNDSLCCASAAERYPLRSWRPFCPSMTVRRARRPSWP